MKNLGLCVGIILLAGLTGCATSQTTDAAAQATSSQPVQAAPPAPQMPSIQKILEETEQESLKQADSACQAKFPAQRGSFYQQKLCVFQAYAKYILPMEPDNQKMIEQDEESNLLAAAKQVDDGAMSVQDYDSYHLLCHKIVTRELQELAESDSRQGQENMLQAEANYDTQHGDQDSLTNETHDLAVLGLQDEQQALSNDRDRYEYCAGLHAKNLSDCDADKINFQADLATYQAMGASIPRTPQTASQPAAETLQQEDIQDDLDAIAGGVVP
jgi:hypothetical protein